MVFSPAEVLAMVSVTSFADFTKNDWLAFSGCESYNPKIGYYGDYILIIDGEVLAITDVDGNSLQFTMDLIP